MPDTFTIPQGTIAKTAYQCKHPSGKTGDFFFKAGTDHKLPENVLSACFDDAYVLWRNGIDSNQWKSVNATWQYIGDPEKLHSLSGH